MAQVKIYKEDVLAHGAFRGSGLDAAHVETFAGKASQGCEQGAGAVGLERKSQAGMGSTASGVGLTAQEQEACAIANHVVDRIGDYLQAVLPGGLQGGDGGTEAAAAHQAGCFGGGAGR